MIEAGHDVAWESRGDKAVYRIIREQPDLLILDIMLPGMQGDQICHTVHAEYSAKILILTAINDSQRVVSSLNLGADDYLTKPVSEPKDPTIPCSVKTVRGKGYLYTAGIES